MRAAGDDGQAFFRHGAAADRASAGRVLDVGAAARDAGEQAAERRRKDDAERRRAVLDERDVDGELVVPIDEFLGAVERVDQPEHPADLRDATGGDLLLGDDRDLRRERPKAREDERLGPFVGFGDGRGVVLAARREVAAVDRHHQLAGALGDGMDLLQELVLRRWHGLILSVRGTLRERRECRQRTGATCVPEWAWRDACYVKPHG